MLQATPTPPPQSQQVDPRCFDCTYNKDGKPPPCCASTCDHSREIREYQQGQSTAVLMMRALSCFDPSRSIKNSLDEHNMTMQIVNEQGNEVYKYSGGLIGNINHTCLLSAKGAHAMGVHYHDEEEDCPDTSSSPRKNMKCIRAHYAKNPDQWYDMTRKNPLELRDGSLALLDCKEKVIGGVGVTQHIHPGFFEMKEKKLLHKISRQIQDAIKNYTCFLDSIGE